MQFTSVVAMSLNYVFYFTVMILYRMYFLSIINLIILIIKGNIVVFTKQTILPHVTPRRTSRNRSYRLLIYDFVYNFAFYVISFDRGQGQHYIMGTNIYGFYIITYTKSTYSAIYYKFVTILRLLLLMTEIIIRKRLFTLYIFMS